MNREEDDSPDSTVNSEDYESSPPLSIVSVPRRPPPPPLMPIDRGAITITPVRNSGQHSRTNLMFKPGFQSASYSGAGGGDNNGDGPSTSSNPPVSLQRIAQMVKGINSTSTPPLPSLTPYPRSNSEGHVPHVRNFLQAKFLRVPTPRVPDNVEDANATDAVDPWVLAKSSFARAMGNSVSSSTSSSIQKQPPIKLQLKRKQPDADEPESSSSSEIPESDVEITSVSRPVSSRDSPSSSMEESFMEIAKIKGMLRSKGTSISLVPLKKARTSRQPLPSKATLTPAEDNDDESNSLSRTTNSDSQSRDVDFDESRSNTDGEGARRTQRQRKPTKHFTNDMIVPRLKIKTRHEPESADAKGGSFGTDMKIPNSTTDTPPQFPRSRGRPRGSQQNLVPQTPRPRGRPRGSTNKVRTVKEEDYAIIAKQAAAILQAEMLETDIVTTSSEFITNLDDRKGDMPAIRRPLRGRGSRGPRGSRIAKISVTPQITPESPERPRRGRGSRGKRGTSDREKPPRVSKSPSPKKVVQKKQPLQVFEEETRMSADIKLKPTVLEKITVDDETSNVSSTSTSTANKTKKFSKEVVEERIPVTAQTIFEYKWPQDNPDSEFFMLQEQISEYLGIKSFKRKYPDLNRRTVEMEERDFLQYHKVVTVTQCDLGLTALSVNDVLDIMFNDFHEKYEEYTKVIQEKKAEELVKQKAIAPTPVVRDRSAEYMRRIVKSCVKFNLKINKMRREDRICSFDLQTETMHYPVAKRKVLPPHATKVGHFPVQVLPDQYCDHYKRYTPTELKYLPLNSVLYGPIAPQPKQAMGSTESEESCSDSDDSSSSDESSSSGSEDESSMNKDNNTNDVVEPVTVVTNGGAEGLQCKTCSGSPEKNKVGLSEVLIHCTKCDIPNHPTCLDLSLDMIPFIKKYNWQCTDCKNCIECNDPADEDKMLFCDLCDRGYHIYCVGLRKVPTGRWHCKVCSLCFSCGVKSPSADDRTAEWHHEYKKGDKGNKYFLHSLCVSCHKLYKKGQFCPACLKCHQKFDSKCMLECRACEKWVHKECGKRSQSVLGFMCKPCDAAFRSRAKLPSHVN